MAGFHRIFWVVSGVQKKVFLDDWDNYVKINRRKHDGFTMRAISRSGQIIEGGIMLLKPWRCMGGRVYM